LTGDVRWRRIASTLLISFFLASLLFPLCAASEPSLILNPVTHDLSPVDRTGTFSSEVVIDNIHISGTTTPDTKISVTKTIFGAATESSVPVSPSGSFSTRVQLEVGPGSTQAAERGDIKVKVVATQGKATKELDVPLSQEASGAVAPNLVGAALNAGTQGYPHTFVAHNNPWLFYTGQYTDDSGKSVQTTKDAVATQLAKFSAVSLHYTDEASNIALIKQKNPNTKVFAYINPMFCYKSSSEYQNVVQHHPEWFLYPSAADRQNRTNPIVVYDGTEQVMDLTTGWQAEIVNLSKDALVKGFDGLYIDCVCDDPSLCYGYGATTAPAGNWHTALNAYLDQVRFAGKLNFYNGQSPVVVPTNRDFLDRTDGWMDEGFISYKGWKLSAIDMPQYASAQNKFTMFYANSSVAARHFYFASALLSDGYFFYAPTSTQWFAEYGTYRGDPTGQAYQIQGFPGVWARDYTAAKVIVNPTSQAVTVSMPGYVDSSGKPASQITINPNDGVILKSSIQPTQLSLSSSTTTPAVGQSVTFTATLKSGTTPLSSKSVTIYHYLNGVRYNDVTINTDSNGKITLTQKFASAAQRPYYATFPGDSSYRTSTSSVVNVNVGSTQITLSPSTTTPAVGQSVTFTATLKSGTTPLSSKSVTIYHYLNGVRYTDTTKTTNANGQITLTQSFGSAAQRPYYATFPGGSSYKTSTSSVVNINVGSGAQTTTTLSPSTTTPAVGQSVTFTATLKSGTTPLSSKSVTIYHYLNGVRYTDTTKTTNANGQITLTQSFSSAAQRPYYATFPGDSSYKTSTSSVVNINVGSGAQTTTTLSPSTTAPAVGQSVTFTATLKSGTTPLSSKSVTIYHYLNGVRYNDVTINTDSNGKITLTQKFASAAQRPYYATFPGDSSYRTSTSSVVNVNVH